MFAFAAWFRHRRVCWLLLALLAAAAVSLQAQQQQPLSIPRLLPSDCLAYVQVTDIQELWQRAKESALGHLSEEDREKFQARLEEGYRDFVEVLSAELGTDLDRLFEEIDGLYFALLRFWVGEDEQLHFRWLAVLESVAPDFFRELLEGDLQETFHFEGEERGWRWYRVEVAVEELGITELHIAVEGPYAFVTHHRETLQEALARRSGAADATDSLAANQFFQEAIGRAGENTYCFGYAGTLDIFRAIEEGQDRFGMKLYQQIEAVLEFKSLRWVTFYARVEGEYTRAEFIAELEPHGSELYDLLRQPPAPLQIQNALPDSALLVVDLFFHDAVETWLKLKQFIVEKEKLFSPEEAGEFEEGLADFESALGVRVDDVLATLGRELCFYLDRFEETIGPQSIAIVAQVQQPDRLRELLETLRGSDAIREEFGEEGFKERSYQGYTIYYLSEEEPAPAYAIIDEIVLLAFHPDLLQRFIDALEAGEVLANAPAFQAAVESLPEENSKLIYYSMQGLTELFLTTMGMDSEEDDLDILWKQDQGIAVVTREKDDRVEIITGSSLGATYLWSGLTVGVMLPAIAESRHQAAETECSHNLRQLGVCLQGHALQQEDSQFPDSIDVLAEEGYNVEELSACPVRRRQGQAREESDYVYLPPVKAERLRARDMLLYDAFPHRSLRGRESRNVLFGDLHVETLGEDSFREAAASQLREQLAMIEEQLPDTPQEARARLEALQQLYRLRLEEIE